MSQAGAPLRRIVENTSSLKLPCIFLPWLFNCAGNKFIPHPLSYEALGTGE